MENNDDVVFHSPVYHNRDRSRTPPMFSYPSYPGPDEILMDPYASTQPYPPAISSADPYPNYMTSAAMPVTLPAMSTFGDHVKSNEDSMNPYLNYSFVPSAEVNMSSHFESSNAHVSRARQHLPVF